MGNVPILVSFYGGFVDDRHIAGRRTIASYRDPAFVLGGWIPKMAPLILSQPQPVTAKPGEKITLRVQAAAMPEPSFQWFKNGKKILGATGPALVLEGVSAWDAAEYSVIVRNSSGTVTSNQAAVKVR